MQKPQRAHAQGLETLLYEIPDSSHFKHEFELKFDRSYVKHIDMEILKINKPRSIQNITGYMVSITLI